MDNLCLTSDPAIYAIGECAAWNGSIFGLVAPGYQMARLVSAELCHGQSTPFTGADMSTKLKLLGVDVGSIGDAHGATPGARSYRYIDEASASYRRLVVSADGKQVLGAVLVGDNSYYDTLLQYAQNGIPLPQDPASLIMPVGEGAPTLGADALPATATLCSCHNVTKGAVCAAIDAGCTDLAGIKSCTKAATGCGGCAALVKQVFEHELLARGVEVDKSLCEHFAHTRQQLYHLVRVEGIQSFDDLLARHGRGHHGCDICKPAVANILASCWNAPITDPHLVPLQDTNDTFMANMQKNGTYSVVPRIPGGEITPEGPDRHWPGGEEIRPLHQDHRRPAHRPVRRPVARIAGHLGRADRRRLRDRPCLWQVHPHGEELRGQHLVPLRGAGQRQDGAGHRAPLQGPARPAQAQVRRQRLHPRMRRGTEQGHWRDRHRERLEPLCLRQRRHAPAPRRAVRHRPRRRDADPLHRSPADVLHPHRRPACSAPRCGANPWRAALTTSSR
ncbi:bacterioferritin-associated ferredoxin [Pseudomonas psychrotolerans]|nr:bacterioferritin-associated ferredoxin [Pseudomonas psychrotolerans]